MDKEMLEHTNNEILFIIKKANELSSNKKIQRNLKCMSVSERSQ
jgi:uncharacterized protein YqgV (UPF0045/DUF77 family)